MRSSSLSPPFPAIYLQDHEERVIDFTVVQGDIAEQDADVLVNAAGTSLEMGSGVAGALRNTADGPINDEATSKGPIDLGAVAVTDAYDLDAEYVVHAAAMPHYGDGKATEESIRDATRNALEKADELDCESIVVPILGTGDAGVALDEGTRFVCEEIHRYEPRSLAESRVIGYADEERTVLAEIRDGLTAGEL